MDGKVKDKPDPCWDSVRARVLLQRSIPGGLGRGRGQGPRLVTNSHVTVSIDNTRLSETILLKAGGRTVGSRSIDRCTRGRKRRASAFWAEGLSKKKRFPAQRGNRKSFVSKD